MADASHLERMGRELKCPICLSLLNSAVSLTCNHVFCNSCIEKSMKAASSCPVCKVPYRRREIRSAPHMDNLVSVYKSMEVASGVNIFVTQTAASAKLSGQDNQTGVNIYDTQHVGQKQHQRKGPKSASVTTKRFYGSNSLKPSFPTKKRVQLPQYTTSGTELEHGKLEASIGETDRTESNNCPVLQKDIPFTCDQGKPMFSPFFWLREEEDLEELSQETDDNQFMHTPPDAPCFSDIKDSDDEAHLQMTPGKGPRILSNNVDFIDSEMFDWTQRPCSPELCSSPLAIQIEDTEENGTPKKPKAALTETTGIRPNNGEGKGKRRRTNKTSKNKGGMRTSNKKVSDEKEPRKNKRVKVTEVTAVDTELGMVTGQDVRESNTDCHLVLKGKSRKSKTVLSDASVGEKIVLTLSPGTEYLVNSNETKSAHISASKHIGKSSEEHRKLKSNCKRIKSTKKTLVQPQKGSEVKIQRPKTGKGRLNTEQHNEGLISQSHANFSLHGNDKEVSDRCINRTYSENNKEMSNALKKVKCSVEGTSKDNNYAISLDANDEDPMRSFQEIQGSRDHLEIEGPPKIDKSVSSLNSCVLLKCNSSLITIRCAFCQSSEESEASGSMVHYLNGKLMVDDQIARKNVIHVHRNCAEWAPKVYFEDDNVVNLETELSRSRRIRCCCCGIKGAALGCYEKSCRKSFHVLCARLTPECRWDYENFVMLCPMHTSSQLPTEMPQSESRPERKPSAERKSCIHQDQVKTTEECTNHSILQWKSQKKFKNLVLSCSALTNAEKEIVTEFEKLSGVTILKKWDPVVTHVIASIDENGACRRTLKFLMGVLEGRWILSVQWIKACIKAGELVDAQQYEISVDAHGIRDGPKLGRLRLLNKQSKLFDGYAFYFMGDFVPSYRGYLHDLVIAAGGKVLNRKPVAGDRAIMSNRCPATTFVVYSTELPDQCHPANTTSVLNQRRAHAEAFATSAGALVASNSWIMNSIAGYKLQKVGE